MYNMTINGYEKTQNIMCGTIKILIMHTKHRHAFSGRQDRVWVDLIGLQLFSRRVYPGFTIKQLQKRFYFKKFYANNTQRLKNGNSIKRTTCPRKNSQ